MKSSMPYHGVKTPLRRKLVKAALRARPPLDRTRWHDAVVELWDRARRREERYAAIDLLTDPRFDDLQSWSDLRLYERLIVEGAWWDLVDPVAIDRLGFLYRHSPGRTSTAMRRWARGRSLWKRRAAIISQLRRKANTDPDLLVECIEPSMASTEFFLRKAIGWALRDYATVDERWVIATVRRHADDLSGLTKREALKTPLREGRLRKIP